ncbi:MAG: hypothetical protein M1617_00555 [Actinobacteria bacterium]|nr:hypothetical protein [Actinomycetota bacterium]
MTLYLYWLRIAFQHLRESKVAHGALLAASDTADNEQKIYEMDRVFVSSMQCVVAAAVAVEAFYAMTKDYIDIPPETVAKWNDNKLARPKRISEVFRQAFKLQNPRFEEMRQSLCQLFEGRDLCVHPSAGHDAPELYDELSSYTDWRVVAFRHENAKMCLGIALSTIAHLIELAPRHVPALGDHCLGYTPRVRSLVQEWESEFGSLEVRKEKVARLGGMSRTNPPPQTRRSLGYTPISSDPPTCDR